MTTAQSGNLNRLDALLAEVRGIPLSAFDSFPDLKRLELLANACRHGDGNAAERLYSQSPELWPDWIARPRLISEQGELIAPVSPPSFDYIVVPRHWLDQFVDAIVWFWDDAEYVYLNALQPHDGALKRMELLHKQRLARSPR